MRTTVRIDDDLLRELKEEAHSEGVSLTCLINRVLRRGIASVRQKMGPQRKFREQPARMGEPHVDLTKATALAAAMEDSFVIEKLERRK